MTKFAEPMGPPIIVPANGEGPLNVEFPDGSLGGPGKYVEIHFTANYETNDRSIEERETDTSPRTFEISATLGKSHLASEAKLPFVAIGEGESFLIGPPNLSELEVTLESKEYLFYKNRLGEYSFVKSKLVATNYKQAHHAFLFGLARFLDYQSYYLRCPIFIRAVRVDDPRNGLFYLMHVSPYKKAPVPLNGATMHSELSEVYALYREGMNGSSGFYKFFCFYKMAEGMLSFVLPKLNKRARSLNIVLEKVVLLIPDDDMLVASQKKYIGTPVKNFVQNQLTTEYRNKIGHFGLKDGAIAHLSHPAMLEEYNRLVYITELCVRIILNDCERILDILEKAKPARL